MNAATTKIASLLQSCAVSVWRAPLSILTHARTISSAKAYAQWLRVNRNRYAVVANLTHLIFHISFQTYPTPYPIPTPGYNRRGIFSAGATFGGDISDAACNRDGTHDP